MKTLKLLGIIALSALIVFGTATCELPEEIGELEGELTITINGATADRDTQYNVGVTLTAKYDGEEEITYEWFRDGTSMVLSFNNPDDKGFQQTYVTGSVGGYTVKAKPAGATNDDFTISAKNGPIYVIDSQNPPVGPGGPTIPTVPPTNREYYVGTWKMTGADNGGWLGGWATIPSPIVTDETMVITANSFRVDSTHPGTTGSTGNTPTATNEFIEYNIVRWDIDAVGAANYSVTYRLTVNNAKNWGYTITTGGYIYLYAKSDGTLRWGNNKNASGSYNIWESTQSTATDKTRVYVRQ